MFTIWEKLLQLLSSKAQCPAWLGWAFRNLPDGFDLTLWVPKQENTRRTFFVDIYRFYFASFNVSLCFQESPFEWTILRIMCAILVRHWHIDIMMWGFLYFTFSLILSLLPFTVCSSCLCNHTFVCWLLCPAGTEHFCNSHIPNRQGTSPAGVPPTEVWLCWFCEPLHWIQTTLIL